MNLFLPGSVTTVANVTAGGLILFSMPNKLHAGIVLMDGNSQQSILDLDAVDERGNHRFMIYSASNFASEPILSLSASRISPDLSTDSVGHWHNLQGHASRSLYLTDQGPVVNAGRDHFGYKINLSTGTISHLDLDQHLHVKRWVIELEDGTGRFTTLREYVA